MNEQPQSQPQPSAPQPHPAAPQAPQPPQPPQPGQSAIMSAVHPPQKKKKTGLVLGIIFGVLGLMLVTGGVLFYFLYWQNPNVIIADSIARTLQSEKLETTGTVTINSESFDMTFDLASATDGISESADIKIKVAAKDLATNLELSLSGVYGEDGTLYVRAGGVKEVVDQFVSELINRQMAMAASSGGMTAEEMVLLNQYAAQAEAQMRQMIDPIIQKVDNQWLKISADSLKGDNKSAACTMDVMKKLKTDKKLQQELVAAYRQHNFLIVKNEVGQRDGSTGYEMVLEGPELEKKLGGFTAAVKETELAKLMRECDPAASELDAEKSGGQTDDQAKRKLVVWVDRSARKLTGVDVEIENGGYESAFALQFNEDAVKSVSVPSGARDASDVVKEIQGMFGQYMPQQQSTEQSGLQQGISI